jgi:hypothetical protein
MGVTSDKGRIPMKMKLMATAAVALFAFSAPGYADEAAAKKWITDEFQPSTLSADDQMKEMQWFIKAAEPAGCRNRFRHTNMNPTYWPRRFLKSPASRSTTRSLAKAKLFRLCKHRCRPIAISMMAISTTRI